MRTMSRTTGLIVMLLLVGGCSLERLQTESAALRISTEAVVAEIETMRAEAQTILAAVEATGVLSDEASARLEWLNTNIAKLSAVAVQGVAQIGKIDDKIQGAETTGDLVLLGIGVIATAFGVGGPWKVFSGIARRKLEKATWGQDQALDLAKGRQIEAARSRQAIVAVVRSIDDAKAASEDVGIIALDRDKLVISQIAHKVTDIVTAAREGEEWKVDEAINAAND